MPHPVYRNIAHKDTLYGLGLMELCIFAVLCSITLNVMDPKSSLDKLLALLIVGLGYLLLKFMGRHLEELGLVHMVKYLFGKRVKTPEPDYNLKPWELTKYHES